MRIPLVNKAGEITSYALVDDDQQWLLEWPWHESNYGYAVSRKGGVHRFMHREVLGLTDPKLVTDHINFNRLDNRRENLRAITKRGNSLHSPKQRGASFHKCRGQWRAYAVLPGGKHKHLSYHATKEEALAAAAAVRAVHIQEEIRSNAA